MTGSGEAKTARDGRRWTLRPGAPDRWPRPGPPVRRRPHRGPLADHDAGRRQRAVGGVLDQRDDPRRGVPGAGGRGRRRGRRQRPGQRRSRAWRPSTSACSRSASPIDWRDVGIGSELVAGRPGAGRVERGLRKISLGVFPDNERAIAVYETPRLRARGPATRGSTAPATRYRDEVLMAWFPEPRLRPMTTETPTAHAARRAVRPGLFEQKWRDALGGRRALRRARRRPARRSTTS